MASSDEHAALRREALARGEATWRMLLGKLAASAPARGAVRRAHAAEARAGVLLALLVNAHEPHKGRSSRWNEREKVLRNLESALRPYLRLIPSGAPHEGRDWFIDARETAERMLRLVATEDAWRKRVARDPALLGPALAVHWAPQRKGGQAPTHRAVVVKALEFGLDAEAIANLESVARLPIDGLGRADGSPLLRAWDPKKEDDTLYLASAKRAAHDAVLRDTEILKRWQANFRGSRGAHARRGPNERTRDHRRVRS